MTTQDIIRQTQSFTTEQKQELAYYFLLSTMSEEKRKEFANLFHYKDDVEELKQDKRKLEVFPKGTFVMTDNFNAPLEDFSEYM